MEPGETPQQALKREYMEETGIVVEPKELIGIRFNQKDWYVAFSTDYVSGHAVSDHNENSEVLWLDIDEALTREDVPDLTKKLIQCALHKENGFVQIPYDGTRRYGAQISNYDRSRSDCVHHAELPAVGKTAVRWNRHS